MTWLNVAEDDPFGPQTLPYGVLELPDGPQCAVRIGELALPLRDASALLAPDLQDVVGAGTLDPLLAAGPGVWRRVRTVVSGWLSDVRFRASIEPLLVPLADHRPVLAWSVADYVDFYASEQHATNVGRIFRPNGQALPVNWKHLPVGYHGRAGTVVVSGTDVRRPAGQRRTGSADASNTPSITVGPTGRLDFEAEVGFVVGGSSPMGQRIGVHEFADHVFGVVLLNDWSARDIQSWEYVPLGPFLGKSFATSVSAWITPLEALEAARLPTVRQDPPPVEYLDDGGASWALDLQLEVRINGQLVSSPPYRDMYWTPAQMLAHLTVNGASTRPGDLFGSGTVSGSERNQRGSMLELSWNGTDPISVGDTTRAFLLDGDEVAITATAPGPSGPGGARIGIAEVRGRIVP